MPLLRKQDVVQAKVNKHQSKSKMKLTAEIKVYGDPKELCACFEPELTDKKRANFRIIQREDHILFEVEAEDSVALRATLNGITKLITVYEKMKEL